MISYTSTLTTGGGGINIFTKDLGADKLQHFSMALGLRPLDTPSLLHVLDGEDETEIVNYLIINKKTFLEFTKQ